MENTDDDALNWAGDDARQRGGGTWSVPERRKGASLSPSSDGTGEPTTGTPPTTDVDVTKVIEPAETPQAETDAEPKRSTVGDSVALIATGILAGVYLLFSIAWLITALRDPIKIADPIANFMFDLGLWLAVAAGPLLFASVFVAGRGRGRIFRLVLLIVGVLVLIPWPYFSWGR